LARLTASSFADDVVVGALLVERDHPQSPGPDRNLLEGVGAVDLIREIELHPLEILQREHLPRPLGSERRKGGSQPQVNEHKSGYKCSRGDDRCNTPPLREAAPFLT